MHRCYLIWQSCRMSAPEGLRSSPDETLRIVQELYEKKLVTYPRTDARVSVQCGGKRDP